MMKKTGPAPVLLAILLSFIPAAGFAIPLEELLESSLVAALRAGERPLRVQFQNSTFALMPRHEGLRRLADGIYADLQPSVIVETLFLYEKPADANKTAWTQPEIAALYNEAIALSTLQGIQYYSASRRAMRTFYETSTVIDNPQAKNPLPDPVYSLPRTELILHARQKDLTFGDNIYQYTYRYSPGALMLVQENLTDMKYVIFTAVAKNNLRSILVMLDTGDSVLFYVLSMAKATSFPGINDRIGSSFSNRAEAILDWAASGADRAFGNTD